MLDPRRGAKAIAVVDPISTGAVLAFLAHQRGYKVVAVFSDGIADELKSYVPQWCVDGGLSFDATIQDKGDVPATLARLRKLEQLDLQAVLVGCESGVELADSLLSGLGMRCNDLALSHARRDKWQMGEKIRAAGLRAVKQSLLHKWEEVAPFVADVRKASGSMKVVLKPTRSAGTDQVYFASSLEEAHDAFDDILGSTNVFGETNDGVLIQEFLAGKEYVVDCVSHKGQHKVMAIWLYDKRRTNGSSFCYYGLRLFQTPDGRLEQRLADYTFSCLDALGIADGPSHAEVMWLDKEDRPCLVEVGARPHGGEGTFVSLTEAPIGYNQLSVSLDLVDDPSGASFRALPALPRAHRAYAAEVCLVSHHEGTLRGFKSAGLAEIRALPSFRSLEFVAKPGARIKKTVDMLTSPGSVLLGHPDREVLERDYEVIHQLERHDLFDVEFDGHDGRRSRGNSLASAAECRPACP